MYSQFKKKENSAEQRTGLCFLRDFISSKFNEICETSLRLRHLIARNSFLSEISPYFGFVLFLTCCVRTSLGLSLVESAHSGIGPADGIVWRLESGEDTAAQGD